MAACFSDTGSECGSSLAVVVDNLRPSPIVIFVAESFSSDSLSLTHLRNERDQLFTAKSTDQHGAELGLFQQRAQPDLVMVGVRSGAGDSKRVKLRQAPRISKRTVVPSTRICEVFNFNDFVGQLLNGRATSLMGASGV